jgi:hypothetical protein
MIHIIVVWPEQLGAVASGGINLAYRSQPANCESHISISYYYIMQALVTFLTRLQLSSPIPPSHRTVIDSNICARWQIWWEERGQTAKVENVERINEFNGRWSAGSTKHVQISCLHVLWNAWNIHCWVERPCKQGNYLWIHTIVHLKTLCCTLILQRFQYF